jgi:hypothetical protein
MNLWEFLLISAIAGMLYQAWRTRHLAKLGAYEDSRGQVQQVNSGREAELEREVGELRERIKVLERIATEDTGAKRLSAEIESLREDKGKVQ